MGLKLITPPANYPVTRTEAKAHLRVDHTDDDTYIDGLIAGVTGYLEGAKGYTGRALIQQTWDFYRDSFPGHYFHVHQQNHYCDAPDRRSFEIPLPPLISVGGVFYLDTNGVEQEFDVGSYTADTSSEIGRIVLVTSKCWPTSYGSNGVRVRFTAGFIDAGNSPPTDNVPPAIKSAMLLLIGSLYENRTETVIGDTAIPLPFASQCLLKPFVVHRGFA